MLNYAVVLAIILALLCAIPCLGDDNTNALVVGKRALYVAEDRPLSTTADGLMYTKRPYISPNAKKIACAFEKDGGLEVCVVDISSGSKRVVLKGVKSLEDAKDQSIEHQEVWLPFTYSIQWSPDSRYFGLPAFRFQTGKRENYILVFNTDGERTASIRLSESRTNHFTLAFSPDSSKIAVVACDNSANTSTVTTYDISSGTQGASLRCEKPLRAEKWDGGDKLNCGDATYDGSWGWLIELDLSTGKTKLLRKSRYPESGSPDGTYSISDDGPPFTMVNTGTGKAVLTFNSEEEMPEEWLPNCSMYTRTKVCAENEKEHSSSLWLVSVEADKQNTMRLAYDVGFYSWSADCLTMAYGSSGQLRVVRLAWKDIQTLNK